MLQQIKQVMQLLSLSVFWALHVIFSKLIAAEHGLEILSVLFLYLLGAVIIFLGLFLLRHARLPRLRGTGVFFIITASLGYLMPVAIELGVVPHLPIAVFLFIATLVPLITLCISWATGLEAIKILRLIAVIIGLLATGLLLGNPLGEGAFQVTIWHFIAFLMPLGYSIVDCYIEHSWPQKLSLLEVACGDAIFAFIFICLLLLIFQTPPQFIITVLVDKNFLILGLMISALGATLIFFSLIRTLGAISVSYGSFIALFIGSIFGSLYFNEDLPQLFWAAFSLLIVSLILLQLSPRSKK